MGFREDVCRVARRVPRGRVVSYGAVALLAGRPGAARAVGGIMASLPDDTNVPWWRVVTARGEVPTRRMIHGHLIQRQLLGREGVRFDAAGRIDMRRYGWEAAAEEPA